MTDPVDLFLSLVRQGPSVVLCDDKGVCFLFGDTVFVSLHNDGIFRAGDDASQLESPQAAAAWVNRHLDDGDEY